MTYFCDDIPGGLKAVLPAILFFSLLFTARGQVTPDGEGTVYVNHQASGNGSSWGNAVKTLSDALSAAQTNANIRTIKIAQGTYYPTGDQSSTDRAASFTINRGGLKVYGGYNAASGVRNTRIYPTVLSGNIGDPASLIDNSEVVMSIGATRVDGDSVVVDGMTIQDTYGQAGILIQTNYNPHIMLRNNRVVKNYSIAGGGGILVNDSRPTIQDTFFELNRAEGNGGAIRVSVQRVDGTHVKGCQFTKNGAENGGAIAVYWFSGFSGGRNVVLEKCIFSENSADLKGGAVDNTGGILAVRECEFEKNTANIEGGALYIHSQYDDNNIVENCLFKENASGNGGAIFANKSLISLRYCEFEGNAAADKGGAVFNTKLLEGSQISGCAFNENIAVWDGGALYNTETQIDLEGCSFNRNNAGARGGAIANEKLINGSSIWECTFVENSAVSQAGGAIRFADNSAADIAGCVFERNKAKNYGGGIDIQKSSGIRISQSRLDGNEAAVGGAIMVSESENIGMVNTIIRANKSVSSSTVHVLFSGFVAINCQLTGNYAGNGGALGVIGAASTAQLVSCTVTGNRSDEFGVIAAGNSGFLSISNCIVVGNSRNITSAELGGSHTVNHSVVEEGHGGSGNVLYQSPASLFRNPVNYSLAPTISGDYTLVPASAGINLGDNAAVPAQVATDLAGNRRIYGGTVDMGAYEYQGPPLSVQEIFVDANARGEGSGLSWNDAMVSLSAALNLARDRPQLHTIHVSGVTAYYPTKGTNRDSAFVLPPRGIRLLGGYDVRTGRRHPTEFPTELTGNIGDSDTMDDNSYHVMVIAGLGADSTIVDGFIISDGRAVGSGPFSYNGFETYRDWGGGVFVTNDTGPGKVVFRNCLISGNSATTYGGGISNYNTSLAVVNSVFFGNRANFGGGLSHIPKVDNTISPVVTQCTFAGNYAGSRGGGIDNFANSGLSLVNTLIYANGSGLGGATAAGLGGSAAMTYAARYSLIQGRVGGSAGNVDGTIDYPEMFPLGLHFSEAPTTNGRYALARKSPAVDKGSNAAAAGIATDLSANPRILEGQVDIGAYEFRCEEFLQADELKTTVSVSRGQTVFIRRYCEEAGVIQSQPFIGFTGALTVQSWLSDENVIVQGPARFVRRYHAVTAGSSSGLVTVTFYYSNADFKAYNLAYGNANNARLPDVDDVYPEMGNIRMLKYFGPGSETGLPGTYPGVWTALPVQVSWDGEHHLWKVTFQTDSFSGFFVTGQSEGALPVTLLSFKAEKQENTVQLTWQTTEEKDLSHFEVERSADARNWKAIGTVKGKVVSVPTDHGSYAFSDNSPLSTLNFQLSTLAYYRLKIVDIDGTFSYSFIESVWFIDSSLSVNTYPNPSRRGVATLKVNGIVPTGIDVYDQAGRRTGIRAEAEGRGIYALNFSNASPGIYTVVVTHSSGILTKKQVIKD